MPQQNVEVVQRVLSDFGDAQQIQGDLFAYTPPEKALEAAGLAE